MLLASQLPPDNSDRAALIRFQIQQLTAQLNQMEGEEEVGQDEKPMMPADATPPEIIQSIPPIEYNATPPVITPEQIAAREQALAKAEQLRNAVARGFDLSDAITSGGYEVPELTR